MFVINKTYLYWSLEIWVCNMYVVSILRNLFFSFLKIKILLLISCNIYVQPLYIHQSSVLHLISQGSLLWMLSFLLHKKLPYYHDFSISECLCQVFFSLAVVIFDFFFNFLVNNWKFFSRFDSTFDINKRADSMRYFERLGPELRPYSPSSMILSHAETARRLRESRRLMELTRDRMR